MPNNDARPAGLAPAGVVVDDDLHPLADAMVVGAIRRAMDYEQGRGNHPGKRALERVLPEVAEALAAVLRIRRDGHADITTR